MKDLPGDYFVPTKARNLPPSEKNQGTLAKGNTLDVGSKNGKAHPAQKEGGVCWKE